MVFYIEGSRIESLEDTVVGQGSSGRILGVINCLAEVGVSAGRLADKIRIGGYKGVEIPFCESASCKGTGAL